MSIHVALHHRTSYRYERPIELGPQIVRLRPAPHSRSRILSYSLKVTPEKHFLNWQQDPQSNYLARLVIPEKTREFSVEVDVVVEMAVFNPFDFFLEPDGENFPFDYDATLDHELAPFLKCAPLTPVVSDYFTSIESELLALTPWPPRTITALVTINQRLWKDIGYTVRMEPGVQTPEETLTKRTGSCRDTSWLMVQLMRRLGIAARFVSGYLIQLKPDVKSLDGPSGTEVDFTDLHAWCEVYLPGAGWVGLDPTSGLFAGEGHIPLAATPDPGSAAPISGSISEKVETEFDFDMKVTRIYESPRVTKPYTEEQWAEIAALGHALDKELEANDVRLTMGGEPTFVSIDDAEGAEWNTTAVGPMKAKLSDILLKRLRDRFAPGAFLHYGQGKWYPGESLPRWSYGCHWRKDGQPLWAHPHLYADMQKDYGVNENHSARFIHALAERLGCGSKWIMPTYEDAFYYLWRERKLPVNVDPLKSNLKDKEERTRLAKVFEEGLDKIIGHVLPLKPTDDGWATGPWFLRAERCYLVPGDSPIGLRLPLDSQPWVKATDYPYHHEQDPMEDRDPLPSRQQFVRGIAGVPASFWKKLAERRGPSGAEGSEVFDELTEEEKKKNLIDPAAQPPPVGESADQIVRTALCVQPRDGKLFIFMPPTKTLEEYLSALGAVEDVALALDQPVVIEGYPPPYDPRLHVLKVTPDPGVIEVNVHPAKNWDEMVNITESLYEEARLTRLGTEKFMVDGRHTGTGGGNHIVMGAETPKDSPFLRRPDLLRSLTSYWQNHPSLSFMFAGMFIGPTSQSPRIDEARNDSLYELEVAFRAASDAVAKGGEVPPWLVDRLYRNLFIDSSGNTHRAEFCIDKLYSPDSSTGRLGLLEMRGFEMPPHPHMSLAQALMLRTLIARFWKEPYEAPLVRWGTDIHDRWMLPHFAWSDIEDVCHDTQQAGFELKPEWFAPHYEFRYPLSGDWSTRNVNVEIRQALEPWHVLGEDAGAGGAVRYVDSSLERIQIKAQGLVEGRYAITCNGRTVPMHPTGTNGEYVAGVRYRAWQPPNCLQPTVGVHSPLTIDLVDQWNQRSLGGCTYHVAHPGGLSYETFPVNAYEAESRRYARFFRHGHTPGKMKVEPAKPNPEFPFTLDLRNA